MRTGFSRSATRYAVSSLLLLGISTAALAVTPPVIIKAFGAASVPVGGSTSLTFTIQNNDATTTQTGIAFADSFPSGLVVATPNGLAGSCGGGVVSAPAGGNLVALAGATLAAAGGSCTFSVNVTATSAGTKSNTTGNVSSTEAGAGGTASASLDVVAPPSIAKSFNPATILVGATTSLTFTISNPNTVALTGVTFSDTLPTGLTVPAASATVCGGTVTLTPPTSITHTGATIAAGSQCQFSVTVTGAAVGSYTNTTGSVTSTNGGTGNTASASLTVDPAPPVIIKAFGAASIPLNGSTSLTFTIQNNNTATTLTGVGFTDALPAGLVVATPNGLTGSCGGGTITSTAGSGSIALSGASLASSSSCTFSVNVTGTSGGLKNNTTGNVTSVEAGAGGTASASLSVVAPPSIAKSFNPTTILPGATTSLTFTITNPNTVALTGVAFSDTLPTGLTVPAASATVCGGTVTLTPPTGITHTGATIAAGSQCQFSVTVTGVVVGNYTNTTGNVTSTNGGTGNTASASLAVSPAPPVIIKAFGAASIPLNGSTSLTFTVQNNNASTALTGIGFGDVMPAGLVVATPNNLIGSCGGGVITATAGSGTVTLIGASLAASTSCTFSVNVTGTSGGLKNNTTGSVGAIESSGGGTASASLNVVAPPAIAKAFNPSPIAPGATTSLTFTITNPNSVALTGVAFSDTLPTGLTVPAASATVCGGTVTLTPPTGITHTGATIAAGSQCQFSVTVTGVAAGSYTNTTGSVTSTNGGTGNSASASLTVGNSPTVAKAFSPTSIPLNGTTTLTVNVGNTNATLGIGSLAFTDTFPAGTVIAPVPAVSNTCGGTVTAVPGAGSLSLASGTTAPNAGCVVQVAVQGTSAGLKNNSVQATSDVGSTNVANASVTVIGPPTLIKAFGAATIAANASTSLTFTVQNGNATSALTGVGFTDTLPAGLVVATPNGLTGSCGGGTITATAGGGSIALTGAALAASASCTFAVNVKATTGGTKNNTTGNVTSVEGGTGGTASASLNVTGGVVTTFSGPTATGTGTATVSFTGGGPTCTFAPQGTGALQSAFFIPVTGSPKSPSTPPPGGLTFPEGLLDFVLTGCDATPVTFTVTYPQPLPAGFAYWKFGPTAGNTTPHWYQLPATLGASSATFTITDGGLGDDDLTANGTIVDQGGPGGSGGAGGGGATQVPTLSEAMLAALAFLLVLFGARRMHRASARRGSR